MNNPAKKRNIEQHLAPVLKERIRLQEYGVGIFVETSTKSSLKKALKKNRIFVNGKLATTATYICGGEYITLIPCMDDLPKKRLVFPLHILFEDDHIAAVHKPAGILVSGNYFKTIANALEQNIQTSPLADATRPQPVHRLDYATTGILLVGKNTSAIQKLNLLFKERAIKKQYIAITIGEMHDQGELTGNIDGKEAQSWYQVIDSTPSIRFGKLNLVLLKPQTGRKHQLRIHLSSMGNPILGDQTYGEKKTILKGKGLYLHAYSVEFEHPFSRQTLFLSSSLPKRFLKIFENFKDLPSDL